MQFSNADLLIAGAAGGAVWASGQNQLQTAIISNSIFLNNLAQAGGAVYFSGYLLTLTGCKFVGNGAASGGAVYISTPPAAQVDQCFSGGPFCNGVIVNACNFTANSLRGASSSSQFVAVTPYGGAFACQAQSGSAIFPTVVQIGGRTTFVVNSAGGWSGVLLMLCELDRHVFEGGALGMDGCVVSMDSTVSVIANSAFAGGGAYFVNRGAADNVTVRVVLRADALLAAKNVPSERQVH